MISLTPHGELSERFKELVLKTSDGATHREFESHTLRQKNTHPQRVGVLLILYFFPKLAEGRRERRLFS